MNEVVNEDRHVRKPDKPQYPPGYVAHPFQTTVAVDDDDLRGRELHRRPQLQFPKRKVDCSVAMVPRV